MAAVLTTTLIDRAKSAADIRDNFVTETEWLQWANQERKALEYLLARSGWTQNVSQITVSPDGTGSYILSSVPMVVLCVHESSTQGFRRLEHNNAIEFRRQADGGTIITGPATEFSFTRTLSLAEPPGETIHMRLYPEPSSGTYIVTAIVQPPELIVGTPTAGQSAYVVYPMGWEEYVVLGMAKRALIKEESDFSAIERLQMQQAQDIERAVWGFAMGETPTIRNVDKQTRGWARGIDYPPVTGWIWF